MRISLRVYRSGIFGAKLFFCGCNKQFKFTNDIFPAAKNAWCHYFHSRGSSPSLFHLESIVDLVKQSCQGTFSFPPNIDIVTGGFPCQDFSVAGKRKGFKSYKSHKGILLAHHENHDMENRGTLYLWMKKVIEIVKPKIFIAENVKGLVSFSNLKKIIEKDFRSIDENGYLVISKLLYAPDYGIPQKRERIIFIGLNKRFMRNTILNELTINNFQEALSPFPVKTHYDPSQALDLFTDTAILKPYVTVRSILEGLSEPDRETHDLAQTKYSKAKYCPNSQGQTEVDLHGLGPTIRAEHHGNIEYRRLSKEHGGKYEHELKQGLTERRLTVRECARIQTFPDDYEFVREKKQSNETPLGASNAYKLIGNAVPPLLAYHLAKRLEQLWNVIFEEKTSVQKSDKKIVQLV